MRAWLRTVILGLGIISGATGAFLSLQGEKVYLARLQHPRRNGIAPTGESTRGQDSFIDRSLKFLPVYAVWFINALNDSGEDGIFIKLVEV